MARVIPLDGSSRRDSHLEDFVREHGPKLKRLITRMVGDGDADDLLQETFLRICRGLSSFRSDSSAYTWSYRIAVNVCLSFLKRNKRRAEIAPAVGLEMIQESQMAVPSEAISPEHAAEQQILAELLREGLMSLRPELRIVLVLRDVEGLSYKETADVLGVPVGTVQSRLHKARVQLREIIRPKWEGV
jgi:RNA polymerase sigma-70 factor (ECF subfamily)